MSNPEPKTIRTGRLGEVFVIAFPLIITSGTFAFKLFSDRVMLAWHSDRAIAAAIAAGITAFMLCSFFIGVAGYGNAFVAQYSGAERHDRTGLAVWQSMLFSLVAGLFLTIVGHFAAPLFHRIGHAPELALEEEAYFLVLTGGNVFALLNASIMCFWTGRGKTWTVVAVSLSTILLNLVFNWALIFGAAGTAAFDENVWPLPWIGMAMNSFSALVGAPALGVVGAAAVTVATDALSFLIFLALFLRRGNRVEFGTWPQRLYDSRLLRRMLHFGSGNGMQLLLDIGAFSVFNLLMGSYGVTGNGASVGAASGVAISINGVAFIPMLGIGAAASILVGHGIGSRDIPFALRAVKSARILILSYMAAMTALFLFQPHFLVAIFSATGSMNPATQALAVDFLRFAGAFCIADGFFILYGSAIRGAGDTRFSMLAMMFCAWCLFAIPCLAAFFLGFSHYVLWSILIVYAFSAAGIFYWRYHRGKWKTMKVIEDGASQRRTASVRLSPNAPIEEIVMPIPDEDEPA